MSTDAERTGSMRSPDRFRPTSRMFEIRPSILFPPPSSSIFCVSSTLVRQALSFGHLYLVRSLEKKEEELIMLSSRKLLSA